MTTQTEMFPKTTMEVLESLRAFHAADVEKAGTALDNLSDDEKVARRYEKAEERLAAARDLVRDIDRAIAELRTIDLLPAIDPSTGESVLQAAVAAANFTPADFTDEIAAKLDEASVEYERNLLLDPITGEVAPATVFAFYPGDDEPHETAVGDRTRYSELVADYFTEAGLCAEVDADEWGVDALRELAQKGGGFRSLHDIITPADYGQELLVVALEQGSVTGVPAEKVAT